MTGITEHQNVGTNVPLELGKRSSGSEQQPLNGLCHATRVVVSHHQPCCRPDRGYRIAHGNPHASARHKPEVVAAIPNGNQIGGGHPYIGQQMLHGSPLVPARGDDFCTGRSRAGGWGGQAEDETNKHPGRKAGRG